MISKPPNWTKLLSPELFKKAFISDKLKELIKQADKDYVYWDKFKHYPMPDGFTPEEAWVFLKFTRSSHNEASPVRSLDGGFFTVGTTKTMFQKLSYIDSNTSGFISSEMGKPTETQKSQMIISSLTEEAIASSQIEGANTSRKVAKEMLLSKRKARNRDEQMIINNYMVMQRLMDWKDLPLSKKMLLEIQENITDGTLDYPNDAGRFRKDEDGIHVMNRITGEVVFTPPNGDFVDKELDRLIKYASELETIENFIHPVIKACILHFWIAYLHPFVDGNGRTARAVMNFILMKKGYPMFFIPYERREDYYAALEMADSSNNKGYIKRMLSLIIDQIRSYGR